MRGWLLGRLRAQWRARPVGSGRLLDAALAPLSLVWKLGSRMAASATARRPPVRVSGLTVVSVGNLAVGGTGKTPVVAWAVGRLTAHGWRPAVLTGGYAPDEAALHRWWSPGLPVHESRERATAALRARADGAQVIVLDDGFQHRGLSRDLDIVLLAVEDGLPGHLLPRGPFRERREALGRADAVLLTRRSATEGEARELADALETSAPREGARPVACVRLAPGGLASLGDWIASCTTDDSPRGETLAVSAIADPASFAIDVEALCRGPVESMSFPDHHAYSRRDVRRISHRARGRPIVITEKDAIKLVEHAGDLPNSWVLSQRLQWDWGEQELTSMILAAARPSGTVAGAATADVPRAGSRRQEVGR